MSQACSPSTQRRYGLARVCRMGELARSTVSLAQARHMVPAPPAQKRGPKPRRQAACSPRLAWPRCRAVVSRALLGRA